MNIGIENYWGFIIAGVILNLTPGSDTIYIVTRSIAQGRRAGYYSVFGIVTGALVHTVFAAFGLSVLLAQSALLFNIIKYLGVAYLAYLGVKMLVDKNNVFDSDNECVEQLGLLKIYRQGFLTNLLNPKEALFYLSLLPQFINPEYVSGPVPFLVLGLTFMTTGTMWCLFLAYSASLITNRLRSNNRVGQLLQKLSGTVFILLGIKIIADK